MEDQRFVGIGSDSNGNSASPGWHDVDSFLLYFGHAVKISRLVSVFGPLKRTKLRALNG